MNDDVNRKIVIGIRYSRSSLQVYQAVFCILYFVLKNQYMCLLVFSYKIIIKFI